MSAHLAEAAGTVGASIPRNRFVAHLDLPAGVTVSIHAPTLSDLQLVVSKLQPTEAVNDPMAGKSVKDITAAPIPAPTPAAATTAGNAPAPTATPASAPPAAAASAASGEGEKRPTYDDVKARVLAMAKISRDTAAGALKHFGVDNANKLKLEQYPDFLAHADKILLASGAAK